MSESAAELSAEGQRLYDEGRYVESIAVLEKALQKERAELPGRREADAAVVRDSAGVPHSAQEGEILERLGLAYAGGNVSHRRAMVLFEECKHVQEVVHGPESEELEVSIYLIGTVMTRMGAVSEAEQLLRSALDMFLRREGQERFDTNPECVKRRTIMERELCSTLCPLGKYDEAQAMLEEAKKRMEQTGQQADSEHLAVMRSLGALHEDLGRLHDALELYQSMVARFPQVDVEQIFGVRADEEALRRELERLALLDAEKGLEKKECNEEEQLLLQQLQQEEEEEEEDIASLGLPLLPVGAKSDPLTEEDSQLLHYLLMDMSRVYQQLGKYRAARRGFMQMLRFSCFQREDPQLQRRHSELVDKAKEDLRRYAASAMEAGAGVEVRMEEKDTLRPLQLDLQHLNCDLRVDSPGEVCHMYGSLATVDLLLSRYREAEEESWRCVALARQVFGEEQVSPMENLGFLILAAIRQMMGRNEESLFILQRQLISAEVHDRYSPDALRCRCSVAYVLFKLDRLSEAIELTRQVLKDHLERYSETEETGFAYSNLGEYLVDASELDEAEECLKKAIDIRSRIVGEHHADTLKSKSKLGVVYYEKGMLDQAEELQREVLRRRDLLLGRKHPQTMDGVYALALVLEEKGEEREALRLMRQTVRNARRILHEESPDLRDYEDLLEKLEEEHKRN